VALRLHLAALGVTIAVATGLAVVPAPAFAPVTAPVAAPVDRASPLPRPDLTERVAHTARPGTMQRALDLCQGPVAVRFAGMRERLLAEHDFCGGGWIIALDEGQVVQLTGGGISGTYAVGRATVVPKGTSAGVIRGLGDVVAQTCRPDGKTIRLVGLSRLG
jgi:hypothetical protein